MNKQGQESYIKSQVSSNNATVSATTQKATKDAIEGRNDPPPSERGGNSFLGAAIGTMLGGPVGLILGGGIGASIESDNRKEYREVHEKTTELLNKTK